MNNFSMAFGIIAAFSGFALFCLAIDSASYTYGPPSGHKKWMVILLAIVMISIFLAIVLHKPSPCNTYTVSQYKYGEVPVRCAK